MVQIIDDGDGTSDIVEGYGLHNMSERVKGIGGAISFYSDENHGFRIIIQLPLRVNEERV